MSLTKNVAFDSLIFADNVRTTACQKIPAMVESFRRVGYKDNHPLVVSEKRDGDYLVLCGNRRGGALGWLRDNDAAIFGHILPTGKVPCIVHKNLSLEEEVLLRIDHSTEEDRVPLDDWSQYQAIRQLVQVGCDTQEKIADKLGIFIQKGQKKGQPNRSYVQPRVNLARLPSFVSDAMQLRSEGDKDARIRWADIPKLYTLHTEEFAAYPNGDGPKFTELWAAIIHPVETVKAAAVAEKPLSVADAIKRAQATSSVHLRDALLCVTGQGDRDFVAIDSAMVIAETALITLEGIGKYLGEEAYGKLVSEAAEYIAMQTEPEAVEASA